MNMRVFSMRAKSSGLSVDQRMSHTSLRSKRPPALPSASPLLGALTSPPVPSVARSKNVSTPLTSMMLSRLLSQLIAIVCGRQRSVYLCSSAMCGRE